ncbi:transposase [Pseudomonas fragi]|uniref:helix-turn-helix domain-containing protein n=1 Tax=Pseudomonas fragi TaxID=296 RepID=UPI001474E8AB|nr:transposase [Pseudomonas fragi]
MRKYAEQTKLSAVEDYCSGSAGYREVAHRYGVDVSSLRKWIIAYQALGAAGLKPKRKKHYCSGQLIPDTTLSFFSA